MSNQLLPKPWVHEHPVAGDASTRCYVRVRDTNDNSGILVRYPKEVRWQIERDLESRSWCARHDLRVPALLEYRPGSDWFVVEDLGPADAGHTLRSATTADRYSLASRAVGPLALLARIPPSELPPWNAPLDRTRLRWELAGFELWFLRYRCGSPPTTAICRWLDVLGTEIDQHPRRICHRDFHLNNLFFLDNGEVGVIDFQDILIGPDTYDMVSLLNERAMPGLLDEHQRGEVARVWAHKSCAVEGWRSRAKLVRIQRALKVLGTFARLEATGNTDYVPWLLALAHEVAYEVRAAGAPPELGDILLDL